MSPKSLIEQGAARLAKAHEDDPAAVGQAEPAPPAAEPAEPAEPAARTQRRRGAAALLPPDTYPVHLPRREPEVPLNADVPWSLHHGLKLLAAQQGVPMKELLAAAIRREFAAAEFTPPDFFRDRT